MIDSVRAFIESRVWPREAELLRAPSAESLRGLRDEVRRNGWWAPPLPKEWGGLSMPLVEFAHLSEILGTTPFGHYLFNCQAPDIGNMEILLRYGTSEQQHRWLKPLANGEVHSCFAMTEPEHAGSNPTWLSTTARVDGNDYVINGHKWFTTAADGSAFAIVMAVTDPDAPPHKRASQIIVPRDTPGFHLVRNIPVMGEAGGGSFSHGEVLFEACRVPQANRLGEAGAGFQIAQERLGPGRIHHCMRWIGIAERALDLMCRRALARHLAPGETLASQQTVQNWIAESRAAIDAARLLVLDAAEHMSRERISLIKFVGADMLMQVLDRAIQVHGALGLTDETPLAWWYRHERGARIYDGPDEVHKAVVARNVLRKYR
ncbi:MAG: acyl-CoA dehydrogenase family protein [Candidatus Xenobia bacterium]